MDDRTEPLEDIPTEIFGLDTNGQGQIYKDEATEGGGSLSAAVTILTGAVSLASNVEDAMSSSSSPGDNTSAAVTEAADYVQNAIQVMNVLSDLGKVLPFVSPAFVIIKAIISVEQRARDVDSKCTDLVQRCTFMLSHLPSLKKIDVTSTTRQVIDRMNDALKKAAALIQLYRKQSVLTRRLSVHNKDRFASCASSLSECTNDLMISLQINQSTQLDILTRPIPSDPEDEAAAKFVASHGGLDAVKGNEQLVKQFASEMKLQVDDKVMEQLNSNITLALQQNQDRLEQSLTESVGASVVNGIKGLAAQINESAKEQTFICVQCEKKYHNSKNGENSCSYHSTDFSSWIRCCSMKHPCQVGTHRPKHHGDYPYSNFFPFAQGLYFSFHAKKTLWAEIDDTNFETSAELKAFVAQLPLENGVSDLPSIFIQVGALLFSQPYFHKGFSTRELEVISQVVEITHQTVIFRTSHSEDEFAMAEWVLSSEGAIVGVKITVKASTSNTPFIRLCPIDITKCTLSGEVQALSEGGLRAYKPATPYILPPVQRVGGTLHDKPSREVRKDFKTHTSPNLPVMLKTVSDPPLTGQPQPGHWQNDYFTGTISVFNKHPVGSFQTISFASVTAFYRLVGDEVYKPAKSVDLLNDVVLPYSVDPRQTRSLTFGVAVPRPAEDSNLNYTWYGRAFTARERPLRIKLVLTDVEDEDCWLVLEYVCPAPYHPRLPVAEKNDLGFLYVDDPIRWDRYGVHVAKGTIGYVVMIDGRVHIKTDGLKSIVYKALQTGESEICLDELRNSPPIEKTWSWRMWGLVDLSCQRLYAFKILITTTPTSDGKQYACLGYVACPEYGEFYEETRPIRYAVEMVGFPPLEPYIPKEVILDDTFDDFLPETAKNPQSTGALSAISGPGSPTTQFAISDELNQRLLSIENSLSSLPSLAASMRELVEILKAK